MRQMVLLVGNTDGIGLAMTKRLLAAGWDVIGISRSESVITDERYQHRVADVRDKKYPEVLGEQLSKGPLDLCVYFVGIGELLNLSDMDGESRIIDVNLTGMVKTAAADESPMFQAMRKRFRLKDKIAAWISDALKMQYMVHLKFVK